MSSCLCLWRVACAAAGGAASQQDQWGRAASRRHSFRVQLACFVHTDRAEYTSPTPTHPALPRPALLCPCPAPPRPALPCPALLSLPCPPCCRIVLEAGTKAFLSYVRAYKEHHCRFIFRLQVGGSGQRAMGV